MLDYLTGIDREAFLSLNGWHNPFFDNLMWVMTKMIVWIPLYLIFLYLVIRKYKWETVIILLFAAVIILISDQLSNFVKENTHRLRPSHEPGLSVHLVNAYKGGMYGFYSAHASNTFSIAVFLIVLLWNDYRYFFLVSVFWALLMSFSRIYLGVHYPGDILAGMLAGSIIGFICGKACLQIIRHKSSRLKGH